MAAQELRKGYDGLHTVSRVSFRQGPVRLLCVGV